MFKNIYGILGAKAPMPKPAQQTNQPKPVSEDNRIISGAMGMGGIGKIPTNTQPAFTGIKQPSPMMSNPLMGAALGGIKPPATSSTVNKQPFGTMNSQPAPSNKHSTNQIPLGNGIPRPNPTITNQLGNKQVTPAVEKPKSQYTNMVSHQTIPETTPVTQPVAKPSKNADIINQLKFSKNNGNYLTREQQKAAHDALPEKEKQRFKYINGQALPGDYSFWSSEKKREYRNKQNEMFEQYWKSLNNPTS